MRKKIAVITLGLSVLGSSYAMGASYGVYQGKNSNASAIYFTIDQALISDGYQSVIGTGSYAWDSSSKVEAYYQPSNSNPNLRWYKGTFNTAGWIGLTTPYKNGSSIPGTSSPYSTSASIPSSRYANYVTVHYDTTEANCYSVSIRNETAAHEMGHVYGLAHDDTNSSIMTANSVFGSSTPNTWDFQKLNELY